MKPTFDPKKDAPAPKTALVGEIPPRPPALIAVYVETLDALFRASPESLKTEGCRFDAVNLTRQLLAYHSDNVRIKLMAAYKAGDLVALRAESARFLGIIRDGDTLVATRHEFLLGTWIRDARAWGKDHNEKGYYEEQGDPVEVAHRMFGKYRPEADPDPASAGKMNNKVNTSTLGLTFHSLSGHSFPCTKSSVIHPSTGRAGHDAPDRPDSH